MKLLADENFPSSLVSYLQKKRYDIKRVQRSLQGVSDLAIRQKALSEKRIIISFDKDFLKSKEVEIKVSSMVLDFPNSMPQDIIPYMDMIINAINVLKRKKKTFIASYSKNGLEIVK